MPHFSLLWQQVQDVLEKENRLLEFASPRGGSGSAAKGSKETDAERKEDTGSATDPKADLLGPTRRKLRAKAKKTVDHGDDHDEEDKEKKDSQHQGEKEEDDEEKGKKKEKEEKTTRTKEALDKVTATKERLGYMHQNMNRLHNIWAGDPRWDKEEQFVALQMMELTHLERSLKNIHAFELSGQDPESMIAELDTIAQLYTSPKQKMGAQVDGSGWQGIRGTAIQTISEASGQRIDAERAGAARTRKSRKAHDHHGENASSQITANQPFIELCKKATNLDDFFLTPILDRCSALEKGVDDTKIDQKLEKMVGNISQHEDETMTVFGTYQKLRSNISSILFSMYSLGNVWAATKELYEAYKDAFNESSHLKEAALADRFSKVISWLPWGQDAEQILHSHTESKHDEVKNKYLEFLKARNFTLRELFVGPSCLLELNKLDCNRSRAVLEYAASKGWLYHFYLESDKHPNFNDREIRILGRSWRLHDLLPHEWTHSQNEEYYLSLVQQNSEGEDHESEATYNRVSKRDDAGLFIAQINEELESLNFWAVQGVVKRAVERGLWAEVVPWVAITLYDWMREHPEERKLMPKTFMDKIGNLSAYRTNRGLADWKGGRHKMDPWNASGDTDLRKLGGMAELQVQLEGDIKAKTDRKFETQKDRLALRQAIAKVAAGGILDHTSAPVALRLGEKISIFSKEYKWYRDHYKNNDGEPSDPGIDHEDSDYYTQITDNILMGTTSMKEVLGGDGHGGFKHEDKAASYFGDVLEEFQNLKDAGLEAEAENFRIEMGDKITDVINQGVLLDTRTTGLPEFKFKQHGRPKERAFETLVKKGFVDIGAFIKVVWEKNESAGIGFAKGVLRQIDNDLFNKLVALEGKPEKVPELEKIRKAYYNKIGKSMPFKVVFAHEKVDKENKGDAAQNPEPIYDLSA